MNVRKNYLKGSVSTFLGVISIDWSPDEIVASDDAKTWSRPHGPLRLDTPCLSRLLGPPCYIESTPFETTTESFPDKLNVATPFSISYEITNKTAMDQKLQVSMKAKDGQDSPSSFLVAGMVEGEVSLGPYEKRSLSYMIVPTVPGVHSIPPICILSQRYKTWLVQESKDPSQTVFVSP